MDDKPYEEITSDQLSSIIDKPRAPVIIIGPDPHKTKRVVLCPFEHHHLWADAYDEHGNSFGDLTDVIFLWSCSDAMAIEIFPIAYGLELGVKSSREVYVYTKDEPGIYTIYASIIYNNQQIQGSFEVQIMDNGPTVFKPPAKATVSPQPNVGAKNEAQLATPTQIINAEFTTREQTSHALVPSSTAQVAANDNIDIERKLTKTDITISETSIEERKQQQRALVSRQQKGFMAKASEMTNPITNADTYVATMSYICFATGVAYVEKENYFAGALFLICFVIFAIAKQGLPEGIFTQWLKQRSQTTVQNIHKTIIGDK